MKRNTLTRQEAQDRLLASEAEIRAFGVERLALFGSVLHDRAHPDSDVDLLVQFRPGAKTFGNLLGLAELLEGRLNCRVELVTTEALSPYLGPHILAEAVDVLRAA
jgi:predicted nucleotidyltransferase